MEECLLTIDIAAGARKLSLGRLRHPSQIPVALSRMAARGDATHLVWQIKRNWFLVEHDGQVPSADAVDALLILLDQNKSHPLRQQALESLEAQGLLDLLTVFSVPARRVELIVGFPVNLRLRVHSSRALRVDPWPNRRGMSICCQFGKRDSAKEVEELAQHLRFSDMKVTVNGRRMDQGLSLDEALIPLTFAKGPIRGVIGIPSHGPASVIRFLDRGVLRREAWLKSAQGLVFDMVVEASIAQEALIWSWLPSLVEALYQQARNLYPRLPASEQERIKNLLLGHVEHGGDWKPWGDWALFERSDGLGVSLLGLVQMAQGRRIWAISKDIAPSRFLHVGPLLVLSERERAFVEKHLRLLVREPPRRPTMRSRYRKVAGWCWEKFHGLIKRASLLLLGLRQVPEDQLQPQERKLRQKLQTLLLRLHPSEKEPVVVFTKGKFGSHKWQVEKGGGDRLWLRQDHPMIRAMVEAVHQDNALLYPAVMWLADGRDVLGRQRAQFNITAEN